jgi:hypothetical protein
MRIGIMRIGIMQKRAIGGPEGIRTPDLLTASQTRSQLRHGPTTGKVMMIPPTSSLPERACVLLLGLPLGANWAEAVENDLVARDPEAGSALHTARGITQNATGHLGDATTHFAPDVFVMVVLRFVIGLAVA